MGNPHANYEFTSLTAPRARRNHSLQRRSSTF